MKNSVLIIGLDGVSWDLLKPWIDEGKLPAFKKLLGGGTWGDMRTTIPPLSCSAWTSLFTGKNPGKHGIFEYITDSGELVNGSFIKAGKIWQILSYYDKRCSVINVPMTYPLEKINGYMISGMLTSSPDEIYTYPKELMTVLNKYNYEIRIGYGKHKHIPNKKDTIEKRFFFLDRLYDIMDKRYNALKELMNEQWDFFMFALVQETSMVQCLFWDEKDVILEFFKKIDFYIDDLIKTFSVKNTSSYIFMVSDHGFSKSPTRSFNVGAWMAENGILKDNRTILQKIMPKIYNKLNSRIPLSDIVLFFSKTKKYREVFQRKLTKSSGIYYKYPGIYIRQNIDQEEYEKLRDKIIAGLKGIEDSQTHEKVFQIMEKREAVYSGNYIGQLPDIIAVPTYNYNVIFSYDSNALFGNVKLHIKGKHFSDMYGIFSAYGDEVKAGTIKNTSILDVFPTVLHILNVPLPKDLDGKVLKEIFKENSELLNKEVAYSETDVKTLQEKRDIKDIIQKIEF